MLTSQTAVFSLKLYEKKKEISPTNTQSGHIICSLHQHSQSYAKMQFHKDLPYLAMHQVWISATVIKYIKNYILKSQMLCSELI